MKDVEAVSLFRGEEGLNCAQAVLRAFQTEYSVSYRDIEAASTAGGGRVDGGVCGALYAGMSLIDDESTRQQINAEFESQVGSIICSEIKEEGRVSCKECVAIAAKIISEN